jgi:hypothetical protein
VPIEKYYYSYTKSIKSPFIKTNNVHDKGIFLLNNIMDRIIGPMIEEVECMV